MVSLNSKPELGDFVKDTITGLEGIVIAEVKWINGCERVTVQPRESKEGKIPDAVGFDLEQIEVIKKGAVKSYDTRQVDPIQNKPIGGPDRKETRGAETPKRS